MSKIRAAETLTIMSDGWTDVNGDLFMNILFTTPEPVFHATIEPKKKSHSAVYISHILGTAIRDVGSHKVHALVSDNASNMTAAWNLLRKEFPQLITYGCLAHGLNLLLKDIMTVGLVKDILKSASDIINFFRQRQKPRQIVKNMAIELGLKSTALLKSIPTRWQSHRASLHSLLQSKDALQMAAHQRNIHSILPAAERCNIDDGAYFWVMIKNIHDLIAPVSQLIKDIEGNKPNLSYFARKILKLFNFLEKSLFFFNAEDAYKLRGGFDKREEFIHHPVQLAAHLLNPIERSNGLTKLELQEASNFICSQTELTPNLDSVEVSTDLMMYIGRREIWSSEKIWEDASFTDPITMWSGNCSMRELTKLAIIVLSLPSTSAPCEKNWSIHPLVKTKKRNKLTPERTNKLVSIKFNLGILNPSRKATTKTSAQDPQYTSLDPEDSDESIFDSDSEWEGGEWDQ